MMRERDSISSAAIPGVHSRRSGRASLARPRDGSFRRRLLNPVRLHVDVLRDFPRQLGPVRWNEPAQVAREHVELLEIRVREGQDLRKERVEADVVREMPAEILLLFFGKTAETFDDGIESGIDPVPASP